jgi:hypothetical protein
MFVDQVPAMAHNVPYLSTSISLMNALIKVDVSVPVFFSLRARASSHL